MTLELSAPEARIVGCLVEKQLTTPQQYPLSLNALTAGCNQTSNRDPVTAYRDEEVLAALDSLKSAKVVRFVLPSHGRSVVRYRQVLEELLGLDDRQLAVLSVLLLRGPQTVGELRIRTERMAEIDSIDHELSLLSGYDEPLVTRMERRPGQKEERWADLLQPLPTPATLASAGIAVSRSPGPLVERLETLEAEVADLRLGLAELRDAVTELRDSLGG